MSQRKGRWLRVLSNVAFLLLHLHCLCFAQLDLSEVAAGAHCNVLGTMMDEGKMLL